ncbi:hypothetical protein BRD56_08070 [Thermoplasmatales archaeon SW_10_69_26]|nr:MAG: hypothetical protein BRD56_08070 [Thermoplasmatales archaeon SW_10_69_26]
MRTRRLLLTFVLALLLASPVALAQDGLSVSSEARSGDQALEDASPLEPGDPVTIHANVTTPEDDREWRATLNASLDGETNDSTQQTWTGAQATELTTNFEAPDNEDDPHFVEWTLVVESRASGEETWTEEDRTERKVGFQVRQPAPPPNAENVTVTVETAGGDAIHELGNLSPNEEVILEADVELPERENNEWNVTASVFVDDSRVATGQQQASSSDTLSFPLQFNAPGEEGAHDVRWQVVVEYRDTGDEEWTSLTTREDTATVSVERLAPEPGPDIPWLWILIAGAVVVGGGAGAYYLFRPPKQIKGEPRSQAMQDLEGEEQTVETQEPEVHPQVKILEARAEDLRRMIELARERYEEGEITEHQFEQIKERKEADLEEVEAEIEEYRQEGGQQ